jgi:CP family cyanate transporter-like MFS transporter
VFGWLPSILLDAGAGPGTASLALALVGAMSVPVSVVVPAVAGRHAGQRGLVAVTTACYAGGYLGLLSASAAAGSLHGGAGLRWASWLGWVSAGLLGAGNGAFPLSVALVGLRTARPEVTAAVSALAQGGGYLLAAAGPLLVGVLHQVGGGWRLPVLALLAILVTQLAAGLRAAGSGTVEGELGMDRRGRPSRVRRIGRFR